MPDESVIQANQPAPKEREELQIQKLHGELRRLLSELRKLGPFSADRSLIKIFDRFVREERRSKTMNHTQSDARIALIAAKLLNDKKHGTDPSPFPALLSAMFCVNAERLLGAGDVCGASWAMGEAKQSFGLATGLSHGTHISQSHLSMKAVNAIKSEAARHSANTGWNKAERIAKIAQARDAYVAWKALSLKLPQAQPGTHRIEDFDAYAASRFEVSERTIARWRRSW